MLNYEEVSELCGLIQSIPEQEKALQSANNNAFGMTTDDFMKLHKGEINNIKADHDRLIELLAKSAPACGCNGCNLAPKE